MHITVSLVVLRLSLCTSQSLWGYLDYPYTPHSPFGGTQTIPILIIVSLVALVYQTVPLLITVSPVVLKLSLYSSQSPWWYSDYPYEHHSLPGGTQTTPTLITVSLRDSDYPCTHNNSPGGSQTIPLHITVFLVVLRLALYSSSLFVVLSLSLSTSHSIWWYSKYPCTHRSLPGGTQTIPLLITVCLVALRLSLYSSQSTW